MNLTRSGQISKTCACNDCIFKSNEKDTYNGSKIDRLYYDKYLPLRERKLIDKLVRTRAVYDDIRNRILSLSSVDIIKNRELDETQSFENETDSETNSAIQIQRLVDLVDRGEHPTLQSSVHLHSDCCGCCICSSKSRIQKHYKVHMHIPNREHIDRYVESHRGKMRTEVGQVGFKAAKSDPCMCTLKFSKNPRKKFDNKKVVHKNTETRQLHEDVKPSISKRSIVLLKNAENKVRDSIRSTVTKIENVFHIKKDSIMIFRDALKKKQALRAWECDPDFCIPNECIPDECYEKVKKREANKTKEPPMGYELKRCFCTQQLQKPQKTKPKKKSKVKKIPKTTMTKSKDKVDCKCEVKDSVSTQTKKESLAKPPKMETFSIETVPVVARKPHDLLPYECEPYFCIPGECNPIVCEDRIKHRHQKNKIISKDTNTLEMPQKTKRKRTPQSKPLHTPIAEKSKSSPNAPKKQAVRITSSFKFDIEFFKEKNFPDSLENANTTHNRHRDKSISNNIQEHSEQIKNKPTSEVKINHNKEQINIISTTPPGKNKEQPSQDPLLKRCFCTLKLHKTPKQKQKPKRPKSKMTMTANEIKEKSELVICKCKTTNIDCICEPDSITIKSQASMTTAVVNYVLPPLNNMPNLLPYECEPHFCTPGKCNPKVCEKRIKARNKKPKTLTKEMNTEPKKSTRTIASKSATSYSVKKVQAPKRKKIKTKEEVKTEHRITYADKSKSAPNAPHRQAVKISSNFRFDIEFHKDKTNPNDDNAEKTITQKEENLPLISQGTVVKEIKKKQKKVDKIKPQKMESQKNIKVKSIVAITEPIIKCLCKLKSKKKPKHKVKNISKKTMTNNNKTAITNVCKCVSKFTQTTKVLVKPPIPQPPGLLPYECEPNFCTPGKCDPLVCEERIKMRNRKEEDKEPLLKRCFCTMKLHNENNAKRNRTVSPLQNNLEVTSVKSIGTDSIKIKNGKKGKHKLLPHECEPGVCVPGQCDPYECLKLIKKRDMVERTHQTKYANTESPKVKSVFSGAKSVKKVQKAQATTVNDVKKHESVKKIEKDNDSTSLSLEKSRQSVKFSSQYSFNIEFRKNETTDNDNKLVKIKPKVGVKLTKEKSTREPHRHKKSAQITELLPKDDKPLTKEFNGDRCFCTRKLHKKENQKENTTSPRNMKHLDHQQIYFVSKNASAQLFKQTIVSLRECTPRLCIATQLNKL